MACLPSWPRADLMSVLMDDFIKKKKIAKLRWTNESSYFGNVMNVLRGIQP